MPLCACVKLIAPLLLCSRLSWTPLLGLSESWRNSGCLCFHFSCNFWEFIWVTGARRLSPICRISQFSPRMSFIFFDIFRDKDLPMAWISGVFIDLSSSLCAHQSWSKVDTPQIEKWWRICGRIYSYSGVLSFSYTLLANISPALAPQRTNSLVVSREIICLR